MEMQLDGSSFTCYTRQTDRSIEPINVVNPIPNRKLKTFSNNLKPNTEFESVMDF